MSSSGPSRAGGRPAPVRLGVLFSGGGRTLENLARKAAEGSLPAAIVVAISSHREAGGVEKARRAGIPVHAVDYREHREDFSRRICDLLGAAGADWVALAGFIRRFEVPEGLAGRVLNIHPALLPAFGGRGFYGDRVHRAVLEAGVKFSGCTVHFVNEEYDRGPIILQRVVAVDPRDTVETLRERVFHEECIAYPEALRLCIRGDVEVRGGKVWLKSAAAACNDLGWSVGNGAHPVRERQSRSGDAP